ncbi:MAG: glycosyltransferase, partial [Nitrospirota bacterium]|nr:glycosyltransferase [Nitrospirota bacterium]
MLAKRLRKRGHDVVVVLFYPGGPLEGKLQNAGIRIRQICKRGRWDLLPFFVRLTHAVREENPDILHAYLTDPNIVSVFLKPMLPRGKIVWGVRSSGMEIYRYGWFAGLSFKVSCWLARFADAIIANSYSGCAYHVAMGYPEKKSYVIPNGIDIDRFRPDPEMRKLVRAEWGVTEDQTLIGLVARLDPMKDHGNFLNAAALLKQRREYFRFVCVGRGVDARYRDSLHDLAEKLQISKYIIWVDLTMDISRIYCALDLLVSSSAYGEGISNVIGEAMASGVPCVATDVGDSSWLVGDLGEVVPRKNSIALADAIQRMAERKLHEPARIRQRIADQLSVDC